MKRIQINITVPKLRTNHEAEEFAYALVEHVLDTFNDDGSIGACNFRTQPTPSYKTLVATLGSTIAEWSGQNQHKTHARKNLAKAERIYRQALKVLEQEGYR